MNRAISFSAVLVLASFAFCEILVEPSLLRADDGVEISGVVLDEHGKPVAGADVVPYTRPATEPAVSNKEGKFTLRIPPNPTPPIFVAKRASGGEQGFATFRLGEPPQPIRLVLRPTRELPAKVTDGRGRPIAEATVFLVAAFHILAEEKTNAAGQTTFKIPAEAPLVYAVAMKDDVGLDYFLSPAKRDGSGNPSKIADQPWPLSFTLSGTRPVRVRLLDKQERPLAGVEVSPRLIELPGKRASLNTMGKLSATTDEKGVATFRTIPRDSKGFIQFGVHGKTHALQETIALDSAEATEEITSRLLPLVPLSGVVRHADGTPAAEAEIIVDGNGYQPDGFRGKTKTKLDGAFSLDVYPNQHVLLQAVAGKSISETTMITVRETSPKNEVSLVLKPATRVFGKVTMGKDRVPLADQHLTTYERLPVELHLLPEADRLPKPEAARRLSEPRISRNGKTNMQGEFEFLLPRGRHWIMAYASVDPLDITITDQKEIEVEMHSARPHSVPFDGRVVRDENVDPAEPKAKITATPLGSSGARGFSATAGPDGLFRASRVPSDMLIHARSEDGARAGFERITEGDSTVVVRIGPTASARGRLIDGKTGAPLAKRQVVWGVRIRNPDRKDTRITETDIFFDPFGGATTTNERGEFTISGLVKDSKYTIEASRELGEHDSIGTVTANDPKKIEDLGDLLLPAPKQRPK